MAGSEPSPRGSPGLPWTAILGIGAVVVVLAWRVAALPPDRLWYDWAALLSLYWLASLKAGDSKHWPTVTASVVGFLLAVYVLGQMRHTLAVLGLP